MVCPPLPLLEVGIETLKLVQTFYDLPIKRKRGDFGLHELKLGLHELKHIKIVKWPWFKPGWENDLVFNAFVQFQTSSTKFSAVNLEIWPTSFNSYIERYFIQNLKQNWIGLKCKYLGDKTWCHLSDSNLICSSITYCHKYSKVFHRDILLDDHSVFDDLLIDAPK